MDKTKCITFDPAAQNALPEHLKAKMKADRDMARAKTSNPKYAYCLKGYEHEGIRFDAGYIEVILKGERFIPNENWRYATEEEVDNYFATPLFSRPKGRILIK